MINCVRPESSNTCQLLSPIFCSLGTLHLFGPTHNSVMYTSQLQLSCFPTFLAFFEVFEFIQIDSVNLIVGIETIVLFELLCDVHLVDQA